MKDDVRAKNVSLQRNRRSIRLQRYDYSQAGAYFVTICTHGGACLFGDVADGKMRLNDAGRAAKQCWNDIPVHFPILNWMNGLSCPITFMEFWSLSTP